MNTTKKRLYVDMDGVLAKWGQISSEEELYNPRYFASRPAEKAVIDAVNAVISSNSAEVFILSAYLANSPYALDEKNLWLDKHLPAVDLEHRLWCVCGDNKSARARAYKFEVGERPYGLTPDDILLDDYSKNLREWVIGGGTAIKFLNGINGTKGTWKALKNVVPADAASIKSVLIDVLKGGKKHED